VQTNREGSNPPVASGAMTSRPGLVFAARLAGTDVFDPVGDRVGKVRDVVVRMSIDRSPPRVVGFVVEVALRRRIFVPVTRVTSIAARQVITTGLINVRRFERRPGETLVLEDLLDQQVQIGGGGEHAIVFDVGLEPTRAREWRVAKVALHRGGGRFRKPDTQILDWQQVSGWAVSQREQGAANLLNTLSTMRAADLAEVLANLPDKRRSEVIAALDDERLADVLEELDEPDQIKVIARLEVERAADVLEAMGPDDAADLLSDLPDATAEKLLSLMEPEEAGSVRQLMDYDDESAGGLMTNEPVILPPNATVAEALAHLRNPDLTPALATMAFVSRFPVETPTGRYLGVAHVQRLLREPPSSLVSTLADRHPEPLTVQATLQEVTRYMATYNLVAAPVVDENGHLLGAVSVDDVLDHLLGQEWRRQDRDRVEAPDGPHA
jgi:flagellar motility protein MotE (MotC chaperone)/sporulation protein YlmC with PRC-barrel domain